MTNKTEGIGMEKRMNRISRRGVLKGMAAGMAAPLILRSGLLYANAPSKRITIGMIGMGRQSLKVNLQPFLDSSDTLVRAVNDVDGWRLDNAKKTVDKHYGNQDCLALRDWREIVAREDIDAVMIGTPDHWHVPMALAAVRAGKHVSCEKPLTMSVAEGRLLADAAAKAGVVFRTDSECRSNPDMLEAAERVRNGAIGTLRRMLVTVPTGDAAGGDPTPMPVPEKLDYDLWCGPASFEPYTVDRVHPPKSYNRPGWMRCRNTCEGMITNWGTHMLDVAQLAHDSERTGPVEVRASGEYPAPDSGLWNVLLNFEAWFRYADGVEIDYRTSEAPFIRYEGDAGWIQSVWFPGGEYTRGVTASSEDILKAPLGDTAIRLPRREDKEDFIHGIKTGEAVMSDAEIGHRTCSMGQIAHIAIQRGKPLAWDPALECFPGDDEANALLERDIRGDWMNV